MKIDKVIRTLIEVRGMSLASYARVLGITRQTLNNRFAKDSMRLDMAYEMLSPLDYKLVVMPKGARLPKDSFEVKG